MRRREAPVEGSAPEGLAEFVEADWPAGDVVASYSRWQQAREAWAVEHGWPGGELTRTAVELEVLRSLPDVPFDVSKI